MPEIDIGLLFREGFNIESLRGVAPLAAWTIMAVAMAKQIFTIGARGTIRLAIIWAIVWAFIANVALADLGARALSDAAIRGFLAGGLAIGAHTAARALFTTKHV